MSGRRGVQSFPRQRRIQRRAEFRLAYEQGRKIHGRYVVVFTRPAGLETARLGVTATRRTGGAAVRNRLKRILKEVFRREAELPPNDVVVNVKPAAATASFFDLEADFSSLLRRLSRGARA